MKFSTIIVLAGATTAVLARHPTGRNAGPSPLDSLEKRACWDGKNVGCTDGYCWKKCGDLEKGEWCWTATGDQQWYQCQNDDQCHEYMECSSTEMDKGGCSC